MDIKLHNTLTGKKEVFSPIHEGIVSMYNCGPTVYGPQHVGNLSMFVFTDVLRRVFEYFDYEVKQVINITDIGHLVSDGDEGEDKMTKGLKREGLQLTLENMRSLAEKYTKIFLDDLVKLNISTGNTKFPRASDYIKEQIEMVKTLEEKGFAYKGVSGVYFDTSKFPNYGKLGSHSAEASRDKNISRIGVNSDKKNPADFLLWKFDNSLGWESPWGLGFPGWHLECSAMIFALLGEQIDIHTGGIEHIPVHHNNEIAQSESASGKSPFSRFWLHREHLKIENEKISKSVGNTIYLSDLIEKGIHPSSFRYALLTAHYRTPANLSMESLDAAQNALEKLVSEFSTLPRGTLDTSLLQKFEEAIADDLDTPVALSILQKAKDQETILKMEEVLGLIIAELSKQINEIPEEILELVKQRETARETKNWPASDQLRDKIEHKGFRVNDSTEKTVILRSLSSLT